MFPRIELKHCCQASRDNISLLKCGFELVLSLIDSIAQLVKRQPGSVNMRVQNPLESTLC
jgi:hypothetical protein